jgi:hypothetical protein
VPRQKSKSVGSDDQVSSVFPFLRDLQLRRNKRNSRVTTVLGSWKEMAITIAGRYFVWKCNSLFERAGKGSRGDANRAMGEKNGCASQSATFAIFRCVLAGMDHAK